MLSLVVEKISESGTPYFIKHKTKFEHIWIAERAADLTFQRSGDKTIAVAVVDSSSQVVYTIGNSCLL